VAEPVRINAEANAQQEWQRVRRLSRWANNRRLRRVVVVVWVVVLAAYVKVVFSSEWMEAHTTLLLLLFIIPAWAMRRMGNGLALPTLEDRAVLQYGEEFDALKEKQRGEVFDQQVRDNVLGRSSRDEREADLRMHAEATAYRILSYVVALPGLVCWLLSRLDRFASSRHVLLSTTVGLFGFAVIVFALPVMIRVWTEPDPMGEVQIVARGAEKEHK